MLKYSKGEDSIFCSHKKVCERKLVYLECQSFCHLVFHKANLFRPCPFFVWITELILAHTIARVMANREKKHIGYNNKSIIF